MTDAQIAHALQRDGLEVEYLQELAAALGYGPNEGWTEEVFEAIERADMEIRRRAALRVLGEADGAA